MKNLAFIVICSLFGFFVMTSCADNDFDIYDPTEQLKTDSIAIRNYVIQNGIDATYDSKTGIWFEVIEEGEPGSYTYKLTDSLGYNYIKFHARVRYEGRLLDGTVFDEYSEESGIDFNIQTRLSSYYPFDANIIAAWVYTFIPSTIATESESISLGGHFANGIQKGAKVRFITPSYWAYGNSSNGVIPTNSPLDFTVTVMDLSDDKTVPAE